MQTWDLLLNRPYNDGGSEDSRRIDPENGWTMLPPLYCAVHVNGPINDPSVENDGWSVEIALPLASLMERQAEAGCGPDKTPAEGVLWRLGFRCPLSMPPPSSAQICTSLLLHMRTASHSNLSFSVA